MADGQDIIGLGLDIGSFNAAKKKTLKEFIQLFNDLSKWDGKIFNPVLGDGLAKFNTSVATTNKTLDELNSKLSTLNSGLSGTGKQSGATSTQIQALTSKITQQQKELVALKLQLSETAKELIGVSNANNKNAKSFDDSKIKSQEYALEQKRVVESLKALAKAQDEEEKANKKASVKASREKEKKDLSDLKRLQAEETAEKKKAEIESKRIQKEFELESKRVKDLSNDYKILKQTLATQADEYRNIALSKGQHSPEAKASLVNYSQTVGVIDSLDKALESAQPKAFGLGKGLSTMYNQIRIIAYILPGLGIAGIFSLAADAVSYLLNLFGLFIDKEKIAEETTESLKKALDELTKAFENVTKNAERFNNISFSKLEKELSLLKSRGYTEDILLTKNVDVKKKALDIDKIGRQDDIPKVLGLYEISLAEQKTKVEGLSATLDNLKRAGFSDDFLNKAIKKSDRPLPTKSEFDKRVKRLSEEIDIEQKLYNDLNGNVEDYYKKVSEYEDAKAEKQKAYEDRQRKLALETAKSNIEVKIDENQKSLNEDINSEIKKIESLKSIRENEKAKNKAELLNVTTNLSSSKEDISIANTNLKNDNLRSDIKYEEAYTKLTEDYRQRRLTASLKIDKSEVEIEATKNERIYKDETQTLEVRLKAYQTYLLKRQTLQDLEYSRNIDILSLKANDPTAKKEIEALRAERDVQKTNIQADVEKQVYDITYQSLTRELNLVKDFNKLDEDANNAQYTISLRNLNNSFENKKISYEKYYEARKAIDRKYRIQFLDDTIENDKDQIERTQKLITEHKKSLEQANKDVDSNNVILTDAKNFGRDQLAPQRGYDEAVGRQKAISDALIKEYKVLLENKNKLDKDELARELERIQQKIDKEKEAQREKLSILSSIEQAEKAVYDTVTTIVDRSYDRRIAKIDELSKAIEEQADKEIAAIQNSSLAEKDKTALLIQLTAEKEVREKQAAAETKRLRREQAEFDKRASIAQILFSTALAEIKVFTGAGSYYEKLAQYIATGVIGAAALSLAVSADIPSYEEGTKGKPHKGGLARTGEKGKPELIKEPYRSPYLVTHDNISYLPAGTEVVPLVNNFPVFSGGVKDNSYENTRAIVSAIKNSNKEIKNVFKPNIYIDTNFLKYKSSILN